MEDVKKENIINAIILKSGALRNEISKNNLYIAEGQFFRFPLYSPNHFGFNVKSINLPEIILAAGIVNVP